MTLYFVEICINGCKDVKKVNRFKQRFYRFVRKNAVLRIGSRYVVRQEDLPAIESNFNMSNPSSVGITYMPNLVEEQLKGLWRMIVQFEKRGEEGFAYWGDIARRLRWRYDEMHGQIGKQYERKLDEFKESKDKQGAAFEDLLEIAKLLGPEVLNDLTRYATSGKVFFKPRVEI